MSAIGDLLTAKRTTTATATMNSDAIESSWYEKRDTAKDRHVSYAFNPWAANTFLLQQLCVPRMQALPQLARDHVRKDYTHKVPWPSLQ
jgi:hypothetical protein